MSQAEETKRWPTVLVVVATLIAVLSAMTTWMRTEALDTDRWVDASAELLEEPEFRAALAAYLVDELYAAVDIGEELGANLPEELQGLAGSLAGALQGAAIDGVERVLERPRVQNAWQEANRLAHETFVAIMRDETRANVSTADGAVVLDLGGALRTVGADLGVPKSALDRIPDDAGQVTVFESDELADVQGAVRLLDALSWFLFVVVIALYAIAIYIAAGRRRETVRDIGVALVVGALTVLTLRSVAVRAGVEAFVDDPTNRPIGRMVGDEFTELLSDMATTAFMIGLVMIAYAALLGSHRWADAIRRRLAQTGEPGLVIGLAAVALLLVLIWWSPGLIFERWVTAITLVVMVVGAAIALTVGLRSDETATGAAAGHAPAEF